eukprot:1185649-Prorocentrum_minimum.AAC.4
MLAMCPIVHLIAVSASERRGRGGRPSSIRDFSVIVDSTSLALTRGPRHRLTTHNREQCFSVNVLLML